MPQAPGSKTGLDYSKIKQTLATTKLQQDSPQLYQTLYQIVEAARTFQGFVEQRFPGLDGSLSDLFTFLTDVITELNEVRNNSKYSISITNQVSQLLPNETETEVTFDTMIFDDGLMQASPSEIVLNANGQYMISIQCTFASETVT